MDSKIKYKLWNTGTASKNIHEIDIVFDTTDTTDISGVSCKNSNDQQVKWKL